MNHLTRKRKHGFRTTMNPSQRWYKGSSKLSWEESLPREAGTNPAGSLYTLETNGVKRTMPRRKKQTPDPSRLTITQRALHTGKCLLRMRNKCLLLCRKRNCACTWRWYRDEIQRLLRSHSHRGSQSKFTQTLWPRISQRKCEVSPRTSSRWVMAVGWSYRDPQTYPENPSQRTKMFLSPFHTITEPRDASFGTFGSLLFLWSSPSHPGAASLPCVWPPRPL